MANPSGNHQDHRTHTHVPSSFNGNDWTLEEQAILEEGLSKYASDCTLECFGKIAEELPKTLQDVALRVSWMNKKENSKRRKNDHNLAQNSEDKKQRVSDPAAKSSHFAAPPNVPPYAPPVITMDNDVGIAYAAIGGLTGELLEQNAKALSKISANLSASQIQENINLFCQTKDNILKIMNDLNDSPEVMKQIPPLPMNVNEELANSILQSTTLPPQS